MLLAALSRGEFPVPAQRVVVGKPLPIGRGGTEASIVSLNQLGGVLSGTGFKTAGAGGGGPSGFDSSGMSGSCDARRRDGGGWGRDGRWRDGRWNDAVTEES